MKIIIDSELINVAPRFSRAAWRRCRVGKEYASAKAARAYHNLNNCDYRFINVYGQTVRKYIAIKPGTRYEY